jgi:hypothetical protein
VTDPNSGLEVLVPGHFSESNVRNFAFQVASGLEHLESMKVHGEI